MLAVLALFAANGMVHAQARANSSGLTMHEASYLGIGVEDVNSERAKMLKLKEDRGAYVTMVGPGTPAAKAGIKEGDVITEFNGQKVDGMQSLIKMIRETPAGKSSKVGLWREGAPMTVWATVGSHRVVESEDGTLSIALASVPTLTPDFNVRAIDVPKMITVMQNPTLGIEGESLGQQPQFAEFFGVKDGVLIKAVLKNSAAERAGIKAGDVLAKIGDTRISAWRDIATALRYTQAGRSFLVVVVRNKKELPLNVTIEESR